MIASPTRAGGASYTYDYRERTYERSGHHARPASIGSFCKCRLKELREERGERVTLRDVARWMGADSEDYVRKLIRGQKPIASRDFVIALCLALEVDSEEAGDALLTVDDAWDFDTNVKRDDILIDLLERQPREHLSLEEVNDVLARNGLDALVPIRVHRRRDRDDALSPYESVDESVRCDTDTEHGDPYGSLETEYHPSRYRVLATMRLDDPQGGRVLELAARPEGPLSLTTHGRGGSTRKSFRSPEEGGELRACYEKLREQARSELQKMAGVLADTRNYPGRWSARCSGGSVLAFIERYNYAVPEWGEYYLLERERGEYRLRVSRESLFMTRYLSEDDYKRYYGKRAPEASESYALDGKGVLTPLEEPDTRGRMGQRVAAFDRMRRELDARLEELVRGEAKIRDAMAIYGDPFGPIQFFGLGDDFGLVVDEDYGEVRGVAREAISLDIDDDRITLTLDDVVVAFELGLHSKEEVGRLKLLNGRVAIEDLL